MARSYEMDFNQCATTILKSTMIGLFLSLIVVIGIMYKFSNTIANALEAITGKCCRN